MTLPFNKTYSVDPTERTLTNEKSTASIVGDIMSVKLSNAQHQPEQARMVVEFLPANYPNNGSSTVIVYYHSPLDRPWHYRAKLQ